MIRGRFSRTQGSSGRIDLQPRGGIMLRKIKNHFLRDIINRLTDLETAVSVLVNFPTYQPGECGGFNGLAGRKRVFEMRLKNFSGIYLYHSDSRECIRELSNNPEIVQNEVFFYLDAHWENDCPLVEEIEQIASRWEKFVIMADDFQVPGDK